jgi:hypothetical protein
VKGALVHSRFWLLTSVALVLGALPAIGGQRRLSIDVQPKFCVEPCAMRMTIGIAPHEYDRELIVEADSGGFYRSSFIQLDGEAEQAVHTLMWKAFPAGAYEIRVTLKRASGEAARAATDVIVLEP